MAKSFRFPRWVEKTRTYSIHPVAFIDQPVATPHQPRYAQQLPPGGSQGGCAARVARLATPTRLKSFWLAAANRIPPIHYSLLSITFAHAGGRCRAGQGTNVSIQAPCGIIRRHCRPAQKLSVYKRVVTGEVQEPTDRYKLRASLSGGTAARPYRWLLPRNEPRSPVSCGHLQPPLQPQNVLQIINSCANY